MSKFTGLSYEEFRRRMLNAEKPISQDAKDFEDFFNTIIKQKGVEPKQESALNKFNRMFGGKL